MALLRYPERARRWSVDDITVTERRVITQAITAAAVGNVTEWFDFGVYAYFEVTIQQVFFSGLGHTAGMLATFALFAVAFLVRPLGGMFFGPLADRVGRNRVLATTMILMALGTFAIGCIPSPQRIGLWAPALLLVCRLVQGFSTGGEYGNAMTFIAEYAPDRRRGFLGSFLEVGTFGGYLLGATAVTVITQLLSESQLMSWGWRLPFLVALPMGIVGVVLRSKLEDTPAFLEMEKRSAEHEHQRPLVGERRRLLPYLLTCMGLVIAWNVTNYMLTSFLPAYLTTTLPDQSGHGLPTGTSQVAQIIVMAISIVLIPVLGRLSDRVGRKPIALVGSLGITIGALPMFRLLQAGHEVAVFVGLLLMALFLICFSSTMPSTLPSLFPTPIRSSGLSVSFNIAISLFCGTTSLISGGLIAATGNLDAPALYLALAGLCGCASLLVMRDPNGRRMWGSPPSAVDLNEARVLAAHGGPGATAVAPSFLRD